MKGKAMEIEWRTVQLFLNNDDFGISEVSVDALNARKIRCNCNKFSKMGRCKHVKFIREKMDKTGGVFNLTIPPEVPDEEAFDALGDTDLFRELVVKYGKIEVI